MSQEYEIITHDQGSYHLFLVHMMYRTPHIHLDFEFLLILDGQIEVIMREERMTLSPGDICIINPLQSHEFRAAASAPALLLSLQVPPAFCSSICPDTDHITFETRHLQSTALRGILLNLAISHFRNRQWDPLRCHYLIIQFFYELIQRTEYHTDHNHSWKQAVPVGNRIRSILDYIDVHYEDKISLQDIADNLDISVYYLSHYFKNYMGVGLQEYIMRFRCEKARRLLLTTRESVLSISLMCGFSDAKYLTQRFRKQYGTSPGEYRHKFQQEKMREQQRSMLSTQEFLSDETSLILLDQYTKIISTDRQRSVSPRKDS